MEHKPISFWLKIPILSVDLIIAGVILLPLLSRYSPISLYQSPTSAELGFGINSPQVVSEQRQVIFLSIIIWLSYSVILGLSFTRSLGQIFLGVGYRKEKRSRILNAICIFLSPTFFIDKLLNNSLVHYKEWSRTRKILVVLASISSFISLPLYALFIFLTGFIFLATPPSTDITLCGEKFCFARPNLTCEKNLDDAKSRVVEIIGEKFIGTGFLISDSLVLTNNHVIENEKNVQIRESNGRVSNAIPFKSDPDLDIALVVGQFTTGPHIQFVNPTEFSEGTTDLYAIGFPGSILREPGTGGITVTSGIYSSFLNYEKYGFQLVQTDAAVNPGNSGGPLVTKCGQVFGMVTLSEKYDPYTSEIKEGLNYAISSTTLVPELNSMSK